MDENQNSNYSVDENSFDETIGIFDSYYETLKKKSAAKVAEEIEEKMPDTPPADVKVNPAPEASERTSVGTVNDKVIPEPVLESKEIRFEKPPVSNIAVEEKEEKAFVAPVKPKPVVQADKPETEKSSDNSVDITYIYGIKTCLKKKAEKERNKNIIIAVVCGLLFFLLIPLGLLPIFIIKAIKATKSIAFEILYSFNRIAWEPLNMATSYEVYFRSETAKMFTRMGEQSICSFPDKGKGEYIVIAKKETEVVSVSNTLIV